MARLIGYFIRFVVGIAPWVYRLVEAIVVIMVAALQGILQGVIPQCRKIANEWTRKAIVEGGIPISWKKYIYPVMFFFALLTMAVGWVIVSYITVWIVSVIF